MPKIGLKPTPSLKPPPAQPLDSSLSSPEKKADTPIADAYNAEIYRCEPAQRSNNGLLYKWHGDHLYVWSSMESPFIQVSVGMKDLSPSQGSALHAMVESAINRLNLEIQDKL